MHSMVTAVIKWMCLGTLRMLDISSLIHRLTYFNCSVPFVYVNMILTCQTILRMSMKCPERDLILLRSPLSCLSHEDLNPEDDI